MDIAQVIERARAKRLIPFTLEQRKRWLAERRNGVGGSDAPVVAGLSKWRTAYELWHTKRGAAADQMTEEQLWGLLKEELIGKFYAVERGVEVFRPPEFIRHHQDPWRYCNLDWCAPDRIVECKNYMFADGWGKPGTAEVPDDIYCQCQHQMDCAGVDLCDVAVLLGGNRFRVYTIPGDKEFQRQLADGQHEFWELVKSGRRPTPDWSHPTTLAAVDTFNPPVHGEELVLEVGDLIELCVDDYEKARAAERLAAADADQWKARILDRMGTAAAMRLTDGRAVSRLSKTGGKLFKIKEAQDESG
jgi:putative phage-type endonuclease